MGPYRRPPLGEDDGASGRQHDAAFAGELQGLGELRIAQTTDVTVLEGVLRDDEHVAKAAPGLDEEDLSRLVEGEEVAVVTVAELAAEELADEPDLRLVEW
jgi:hypothetical protein